MYIYIYITSFYDQKLNWIYITLTNPRLFGSVLYRLQLFDIQTISLLLKVLIFNRTILHILDAKYLSEFRANLLVFTQIPAKLVCDLKLQLNSNNQTVIQRMLSLKRFSYLYIQFLSSFFTRGSNIFMKAEDEYSFFPAFLHEEAIYS